MTVFGARIGRLFTRHFAQGSVPLLHLVVTDSHPPLSEFSVNA